MTYLIVMVIAGGVDKLTLWELKHAERVKRITIAKRGKMWT